MPTPDPSLFVYPPLGSNHIIPADQENLFGAEWANVPNGPNGVPDVGLFAYLYQDGAQIGFPIPSPTFHTAGGKWNFEETPPKPPASPTPGSVSVQMIYRNPDGTLAELNAETDFDIVIQG